MKNVVAVICNFNKSNYLIDCVGSLQKQTFKALDIAVVDNASEDDSVYRLRSIFSDSIRLLNNKENLGSSGGFNAGIEYCMKSDATYFLLVDNDTRFAENAVEKLYEYMELHHDVGMCGSQILQMNNPDYIQEMGGHIDYNKYDIVHHFRGWHMCDKEIPDDIECDFVPSCAVLVRREVVEKVGKLNIEHFVYWDDIDWCKRASDEGFKIVSIASSKVWHNWSAKAVCKFNPYSDYYGRRNKWRFFATYIDDSSIDDYVENSIRGYFNVIYGYRRKGAYRAIEIAERGFDDFCDNIWGKRDSCYINDRGIPKYPIEKLLESVNKVYLYVDCDEEEKTINNILRYFSSDLLINRIYEEGIDKKINVNEREIIIKGCPHATMVKEDILPIVYLDKFMNCIEDEEAYLYFSNAESEYAFFREKRVERFKAGIHNIRNARKKLI